MKRFLCLLLLILAPNAHAGEDALDEVNAARAARGLRPFVRDEGLSEAAKAAADFRALHRIEFHTSNDFAFVPAGSMASAAGCAAWPPHLGWGSCCTFQDRERAGAAFAIGSDGRRFMHLYVAGGTGTEPSTSQPAQSRRRGWRR